MGSVNGSVTLTAGTAAKAGGAGTADGALTVSGSDVQAGQDITASGTRVQIDPGLDRNDATTHTHSVTDAVTVAVGGSVVQAAQAVQSLTASATTRNKRLQALALAAQAVAAAQAAAAVAADGGSISASLTASHSESTTGQTDTGISHAGSQLSAGRDVQITATGAGAETGAGADATHPDNGNITVLGSGITAGRNVALSARQDIRIAAAQDTEAHAAEHSDWTVGAGIGASLSRKDGAVLGVTANAGVGGATQQSQARTQLNSRVTAANHLGLDSGRDTTVQGGVLNAERVNAEVGRNLTIASLQDTASASAKSANASLSATVGYGVSVSASLAYAQSKNDFASVDEQSALRAGDGGFNVNVTGHTELQGGAVTSTQQAVDAGRNHLTTATLSTRDIANHSTASGIGLSVSASSSTGGSDKDANGKDTGNGGNGAKELGGVKLADQGNAGTKVGSTSLGAASESDSSTTRSAISGATLTIGGTTTRTDQGGAATATDSSGKAVHTAITGTDTAAKLAKPSGLEDIQAQVKIVQSFGSQASKAVGDYATGKARELRKEGNEAEAVKWDEGGSLRALAHTVVGGLAGGVGGALGAGSAALAAPLIDAATADLPEGVKNVVGAAVAAGIGAVTGGAAGAAAGFNEDTNNRQLHPQERTLIEKLAKQRASKTCGEDAQCQASATTFWIDALERVAKGAVDDGDNAKNVAYMSALLSAAKNPNSEGARGYLENYLDSLKVAQTMLAPYTSKTILTNGQVAQSDGAAQTYFSATPAQRADDWSNRFLGAIPGPILPGVQMRDEDRLERFSTLNGSVKPDYTVEEFVLGGAAQSRLTGAAGRLISDLEVVLAGRTISSTSGNISARQITEAGMQATLTSAERDLLQQAAGQSSASLQGKVSEYVSDSYFARNGYKQIEGKCGSDNCFDAVFVKGDKVYVVESKPLQSNGAIKLSGPNSSTGLKTQMSDAWIDSAVSRLGDSSEAAQATAKIIDAAREIGTLVKLVVGTNKDGMTIVRLK